MATSNSTTLERLQPEHRQAILMLLEHPGWQWLDLVFKDQLQSACYRLEQESDGKEIHRLQGEIRALRRVLGAPSEYGHKPDTLRFVR